MASNMSKIIDAQIVENRHDFEKGAKNKFFAPF